MSLGDGPDVDKRKGNARVAAVFNPLDGDVTHKERKRNGHDGRCDDEREGKRSGKHTDGE